MRSLIVDADGLGDGVVRSATWGIERPAARRPRSRWRTGRWRCSAGASTTARARSPPACGRTARPTCAGTRPPATGLAPVGPGSARGGSSTPCGTVTRRWRSSRADRTVPLTVARVTLNDAPTAALTASPANALGPTATITLDASGTLDPDGPTDVRSYAFDVDGDGAVDVTSREPDAHAHRHRAAVGTATVRATDSLGARERAGERGLHRRRRHRPPSAPAGPPLVSAFPPTLNSVLTPSTAVVTALPGPLVAVSPFPSLAASRWLAPVQVGGLTLRPRAPARRRPRRGHLPREPAHGADGDGLPGRRGHAARGCRARSSRATATSSPCADRRHRHRAADRWRGSA